MDSGEAISRLVCNERNDSSARCFSNRDLSSSCCKRFRSASRDVTVMVAFALSNSCRRSNLCLIVCCTMGVDCIPTNISPIDAGRIEPPKTGSVGLPFADDPSAACTFEDVAEVPDWSAGSGETIGGGCVSKVGGLSFLTLEGVRDGVEVCMMCHWGLRKRTDCAEGVLPPCWSGEDPTEGYDSVVLVAMAIFLAPVVRGP